MIVSPSTDLTLEGVTFDVKYLDSNPAHINFSANHPSGRLNTGPVLCLHDEERKVKRVNLSLSFRMGVI